MRLIRGAIDPSINHEARINHLNQHANPVKGTNFLSGRTRCCFPGALAGGVGRGEALLAQHGEQLELLVALGTRRRGEYQQRLGLVLGEEHLAVQLDRAKFGVDERLVVLEARRCSTRPTRTGNRRLRRPCSPG